MRTNKDSLNNIVGSELGIGEAKRSDEKKGEKLGECGERGGKSRSLKVA